MASPRGASARLRRAFRYPSSGSGSGSGSDSQPDVLDEQEQDSFIRLLASENASRNAQFARLLLLLPLAAAVAYLRPLLRPATALFALLSVTSLLATALLLHRLPPAETGIAPLDAWASRRRRRGSRTEASARATAAQASRRLGGLGGRAASPLETYLPYLNLGLVALLMLMGLVRGDNRGGSFGWVGMGNLPGLIYSITLTAKIVMAGVDPERALSGLRYEYKGP